MTIFSSAYLKLKRARRIIDELDTILSDFLKAFPLKGEFTDDGDPQNGWSPTTKFVFPPVPEDSAVLIGDVIHNLRTSLDHMASELARLNDKNDKNVYFPFGENAAGLEEQIKRKNFSLCGNDAVALLRTLKPYIGGNLELRAIHDLDILDKHRALIPAPNPKPGRARVLEWAGPPVGNRRPFKWIPLEFENVTLVFPPGTVLEQRPIIQTLKELVNVCESVLEAFAALKASDQGGANGEGDIPPQS